MFVVAAVTAAMIIVLSAFNGIEALVQSLFSNFDAAITISASSGKTFERSDSLRQVILNSPGVVHYCEVIEDDAWLSYRSQNTVATIKGVDSSYTDLNEIDSMMFQGQFRLWQGDFPMAVLGAGVRRELGLPFRDEFQGSFYINAPIRGKKLSRYQQQAFNRLPIGMAGSFSVNAELDVKYVIVPIDFARALFGYEHEVSAIELGVGPEAKLKDVKFYLAEMLGPGYKVETRFEKNALVYQTNQSEKWATYLIMVFILCIAAFNVAASLTILIIEKKRDIYVLMSMGATASVIRKIFTYEGVLINFFGAAFGLGLGVILCLLQQNIGLLRLEGAMVEYYPIDFRWVDLMGVLITVMTIGTLFSLFIVKYLVRRFALHQSAKE